MKPASQFRLRGRGEGLNLGEVQKQDQFRRRGKDTVREKDEKEEVRGEEVREEKITWWVKHSPKKSFKWR